MIPETLEEWTLETVTGLLVQGIFESDRFDFKEMLPQGRSDSEKLRLRKTCAAFSNSSGGFLVFGIKDAKGLALLDRIVGVDAAVDFPAQFGAFPAACEPQVEWNFRNPPIALASGRLVHVIHIHRGMRGPHALEEDHRWHFMKRTNRGNEAMSYEEVRLAFQDTEFRRAKLALLSSELNHIEWVAKRLLTEVPADASTDGLVKDWAWMTRYPTTVVDTVLGDAYSLFVNKTDVAAALTLLRDETRRSNEIASVYSNYSFILSTAQPQQRAKLYRMMRELAESISGNVRHAQKMIRSILSGHYDRVFDPAAGE